MLFEKHLHVYHELEMNVNLSAYGNDQENDADVNSAMRRTQEEVAKYTF